MMKKQFTHRSKPQTRTVQAPVTENSENENSVSIVLDAKTPCTPSTMEKSGSECAPTIGQQDRDALFRLARQYVAEGLDYYKQACSVDLGAMREKLRRVATEVETEKARLHAFTVNPMKNLPTIQRCIAILEDSVRATVNLYEATSELYDANQRFAAYKTPLALGLGVWLHVLKANCGKTEWSVFLHSVNLSTQGAGRFCSLITKRIKMRSITDPTGNAVKIVYESALATEYKQKEALWNLVGFDCQPKI